MLINETFPYTQIEDDPSQAISALSREQRWNIWRPMMSASILNIMLNSYDALSQKVTKLSTSWQKAKDVQCAILPHQLPEIDGFQLGGLMMPADEVGGDFFNVYSLNSKDQTALFVGDVSDKGPAAAMVMSYIDGILRAIIMDRLALNYSIEPSDIIQTVEKYISGNIGIESFTTMLFGVLHSEKNEFVYVRAGHEVILLYNNVRELVYVDYGPGQPLNMSWFDVKPVFDVGSVTIPYGGMMVLYTDGYKDGQNGDGETIGLQRLESIIRDNFEKNPQEICEIAYDDALQFQGGNQFDDITLLIVKSTK